MRFRRSRSIVRGDHPGAGERRTFEVLAFAGAVVLLPATAPAQGTPQTVAAQETRQTAATSDSPAFPVVHIVEAKDAPAAVVDAKLESRDDSVHLKYTIANRADARIARLQVVLSATDASGRNVLIELDDVKAEDLPNDGARHTCDLQLSSALHDGDTLTLKVSLVATDLDVWTEGDEPRDEPAQKPAQTVVDAIAADALVIHRDDSPVSLEDVHLIRGQGAPAAVTFLLRTDGRFVAGVTVHALLFDGRGGLRVLASQPLSGVSGVRSSLLRISHVDGRPDWQVAVGIYQAITPDGTWTDSALRAEAEALLHKK